MKAILILGATVLALSLHHGADAQGFVRGAEEGATSGQVLGGPVGAVIGGAVGAATGTVGGILGIEERPRFRTYVRDRRLASYDYDGTMLLGTVLPWGSVRLYDVPDTYGARDYRYTVVNDRILIVHPQTGRVVDVID